MSDFEGMAEIAAYNLRRFVGDNADRDVATRAFPFWDGYEFISRATRDAVLATFPEAAEPVVNPEFYSREPVLVAGQRADLHNVDQEKRYFDGLGDE
jgi:hypothetical protein